MADLDEVSSFLWQLLRYLSPASLRSSQRPEAEIMTMVFEAGLRQLWRERTLGQYLRGEISREQAIESAGIDWVELAEHQQSAMNEDLVWARGN